MRWNRGKNGGGGETETPTPQTKAEPLPATRSLPSSLWPCWLSRFIPQARATNTYAERQYVRGAIARVRRRTCELSIGTDVNVRVN